MIVITHREGVGARMGARDEYTYGDEVMAAAVMDVSLVMGEGGGGKRVRGEDKIMMVMAVVDEVMEESLIKGGDEG
jgi:hypothetical protein